MNIILLASGKGKRLHPETENLPKPLVKVNNKSIFNFFLEAFEKLKCEKSLFIATGFKEENFPDSFYKKINNPYYDSTNMLFGLWYTFSKMVNRNDATIISYGDIIFPNSLLEELSHMEEITIVTDPNWEQSYLNRTDHGFEECEKCILSESKDLLLASKNLPKQFTKYSEFIGVTFIPKKFISSILMILDKLFLPNENHEKPFMFSETLKKSYITDFLSFLIINNFRIKTFDLKGDWYEIDTIQDLSKVKGIY